MSTQSKSKAEKRHQAALDRAEAKRRSELVKSSRALQPYGTPEELKEMMTRMRFMIQGGEKLKDVELWGLAQASYALGLNPTAKEICWIPGSGPFPQIRGVRRKGREQIVFDWNMSPPLLEFYEITSPKERELYKIPQGALAYKCVGRIAEERTQWADDMTRVSRALFGPNGENIVAVPNAHEIILEQVGEMPQTIGIGYITEEEMWERDNPRWWHKCKKEENNTEEMKGSRGTYMAYVRRGHSPCPDCGKESWATVNRYPHVQCARKRAEAHFWYQKCDLPFDIAPSGEGLADFEGDEEVAALEASAPSDFTEGVFTEIPDVPEWVNTPELLEKYMILKMESEKIEEEQDELSEEELQERAQEGIDALFGEGEYEKVEPPAPEKTQDKDDDEPKLVRTKKPRTWSEEFIDVIKEAEVVPPDKAGRQIRPRIENVLNRSPFTDADPPKWAVKWIEIRYELRKQNMPGDKADKIATAKWVASMDTSEIKGAFNEDWINAHLEIAKAVKE